MTKDGQVVLHHDALLGASDVEAGCALAPGTPICAASRAELGHLNTLDELLEALEGWPAAILNVELKDLPCEPGWDASYPLVHEVVGLLVERAVANWPGPSLGAKVRVIVSSFDPAMVSELKKLAPALSAGLLVEAGASWQEIPGLQAVHPAVAEAVPELFERAERAGLAVVPWTVDDPARAAELARLGAAGIITNRPRAVGAAIASL